MGNLGILASFLSIEKVILRRQIELHGVRWSWDMMFARTKLYLNFIRPTPYSREVSTLISSAEVRVRVVVVFDPIHRYEPDVGVTHELLPQQIRTIV